MFQCSQQVSFPGWQGEPDKVSSNVLLSSDWESLTAIAIAVVIMDTNDSLGLHYEGVLEKAGKRFFEGFRKRWFILEGKDLSYYKAPETTEPNLLGIIDMTKVRTVVPFKMINNSFQINTNTRTYTFTAPSSQLMTEWISVLRQAMQLESFSNKRAKSSFRESVSDDGYEVVSRSSRSNSKASGSSQQSFDMDDAYYDDNMYDKIELSGSQSKADNRLDDDGAGTYEAVGSFKRKNIENKNKEREEIDYEVVGRQGSLPRTDQRSGVPEIGTYDAVGRTDKAPPQDEVNVYSEVKKTVDKTQLQDVGDLYSQVERPVDKTQLQGVGDLYSQVEKPVDKTQLQGVGDLYSQVEKPVKKTQLQGENSQVEKPIDSPPFDVTGSFYAEVGSAGGIANNMSNNKPSKPVPNPMPVLVESDVDEEDEDEVNDTLESKSDELTKDPLPPPVGSIYAADEIKSLLKDIDGDLDEEPLKKIGYKDDSPIPESCENAFRDLKQFLVYLEKTEN